jgi:Histidine kinase-, DNA gyrase B-, and HSP90-like ATPase
MGQDADVGILNRSRLGAQHAPAALAAVAALLAPLAGWADVRAWMSTPAVAGDVLLGLALAASGVIGKPPRQGVWVALIGVAWLLGSISAAVPTMSRGALFIALAAFPSGRFRAGSRWWSFGAAAIVALPACPQLVAAAVFAILAWQILTRHPRVSPAPAVSGVAVVTCLTQVAGALASTLDAPDLLVVARWGYMAVLTAVAVGFPWAAGEAASSVANSVSAQPVSTSGTLDDTAGRLSALLGVALGDRALRVVPTNAGNTPGSGEPSGTQTDGEPPGRGARPGRDEPLVVTDRGAAVATVVSGSGLLDDPATAASVAESVRLIIRNAELVASERARLAELAASRIRFIDAADRERAALGSQLRSEVTEPIEDVVTSLSTPLSEDPATSETIDLVVSELRAAVREADALLSGLPPTSLGDGALRTVLDDMVHRSPIPVHLEVTSDAIGDPAAEAAIHAVVAECLTNVLKHAGTTSCACSVRLEDGHLVAVVRDQGAGGADESGHGLQGLADRLAARGGRLRVVSPLGGGTTVEARVPARAQSIFS